MADWLANFLNGNFSKNEREIIYLTSKVAELEALKSLLERENEDLRARVRDLESDDRDIRRGLLTRLGLVPNPEKVGEKPGGPEPVRKVTVPWRLQAAKLEADSRERYWKKRIEDAEKPQEQRKAEAEAKVSTEDPQIQEDIREMEK